MNKSALFFLCLSTSAFFHDPALARSNGEEMGVFFCTRDLSPELYNRIEKGAVSSSVFLATSASIYSTVSLPFRPLKLMAGMGGGAMVAMLSSDCILKLYKSGLPTSTELAASSTNAMSGGSLRECV